MPQTTYTPKPGSVAEKALAYLRAHGPTRSGPLAEAVGAEANALTAHLKACLEHGLVVACTVIGNAMGRAKETKEYRLGSGLEPAPDRPLKLDRAARLAAERTSAAAAPAVAGVTPLAGMEAPRGRDRIPVARGDSDASAPRSRPAVPAVPVGAAPLPRSPASPEPPPAPVGAAPSPRSPASPEPPPAPAAPPPRLSASPAVPAAADGLPPAGADIEIPVLGRPETHPAPSLHDGVDRLVAAFRAAGIEAVSVGEIGAALTDHGVRLIDREGRTLGQTALDFGAAPEPRPDCRISDRLGAMSAEGDWGFTLDDAGWLVISSPALDDIDLELPPEITRRLARFLIRTQAHAAFDPEPVHA